MRQLVEEAEGEEVEAAGDRDEVLKHGIEDEGVEQACGKGPLAEMLAEELAAPGLQLLPRFGTVGEVDDQGAQEGRALEGNGHPVAREGRDQAVLVAQRGRAVEIDNGIGKADDTAHAARAQVAGVQGAEALPAVLRAPLPRFPLPFLRKVYLTGAYAVYGLQDAGG